MAPRFEKVSAPLEQRVQLGLENQATLLIENAKSFASFVERCGVGSARRARAILEDQELISATTTTSVRLLRPTSLPGCLLMFALILKVSRWFFLSRRAHRAVRESMRDDICAKEKRR